MAIISSFLCWSNTRTGSAVCGYYTLVISVVCLAFYMLRYIALDEIKDSIELKGIVYAGFVLYSFLIGVSLILLPGVYMDRKFLLLPWIYVLVITVLYETGAIALITTVHLEKDHTLSPWEIVAVVFYCIRLVANCYCFACVVSQYQELSEGRGTYEFLFKPRRRQMARGVPVSDLEEYHPPYGAALPPYSEVNLYKQYCPPNYENLAMDEDDRRWDLNTSHYGLSLIGAVGNHTSSSGGGLRGAMSTSCLAEVHVSTPPPGFDDAEIYGEDGDYDFISSTSSDQLHHNYQSDSSNSSHPFNLHQISSSNNGDEGQHYASRHHHNNIHRDHRHHRNRHLHHHRHHSLPETQHHNNQYEFNPPSDSNNNNNNNQIEFIHPHQHHHQQQHHHHRHRSTGCKPNTSSTPIEPSRRLPDYNDLHLSRSPFRNQDSQMADIASNSLCIPNTPTTPCQATSDNNTTCSPASQGKDPMGITMTESSGSFLTFSQTDFRTPTPKSSPALSVHSCHRPSNNSGSRTPPSPPPIHKRTYITWI